MDSVNVPREVRNIRPLAQLLAVLAAFALIACAHGEIYTTGSGEIASLSGRVSEVTVAAEGIVPERQSVYATLDADRMIEEAIVSRLVEDGHFDASGDLRVSVRITGFRLRSTANAFWWGAWAGVDKLEGNVDIQQGADRVNYYGFELSGSEEWYFKYGATARFRSLARELAEKISTLFESEGVAKK